ncbi:phage tail tape measure protein [archaeon]|nr:phage tail tape measure protein [archaeon]
MVVVSPIKVPIEPIINKAALQKELETAGATIKNLLSDKNLGRTEKRDKIATELFKSKEYKSIDSAKIGATNVMYSGRLSSARKFWNKLHSIAVKSTKKTESEIKDANKNIREHFETGFSMHILQIYAAPAIRAVNAALKQTITTFSEFDKVYTDFIVKSEEFGDVMSRTELYALSVGEVFSATDFAQAAERFAASGIDVTQNTDALRKSLELASIANIDYNESSNVLIKTMQAYHIPLSEAARITDTMVGVANASTAELKDLSSWFGYAANSAYIAGTTVEEFSTILGVLSSTGMKNVGAATRQLFTQFQKESVRDNFRGMFGLDVDEDFRDMDEVIKKLRAYTQASGDLKGVSREIAVAIGGKVTAQNALNNLLGAEESLWQSVSAASMKAGTTAELYTKITDNAWHSLERIKNSLELVMIQFGEMFAPILKVISAGLEMFVKSLIAVPSIIKSTFGVIILTAATALGAIVTVALAFTGAISIVTGATQLLTIRTEQASMTNARARDVWVNLTTAIWNYNVALFSTHKTQATSTKLTENQTRANVTLSTSLKTAQAMAYGFMGAMIGFGIQASVTAKHMFAEAKLVNLLTAAWIGYHAAKFGGPLAPFIAVSAAGASLAYGESQIHRAEIAYGMERRAGVGSNTYISHTYNVEMSGVNNPEDMITQLNTFGDFTVTGVNNG